jgi:hypothetical protein
MLERIIAKLSPVYIESVLDMTEDVLLLLRIPPLGKGGVALLIRPCMVLNIISGRALTTQVLLTHPQVPVPG